MNPAPQVLLLDAAPGQTLSIRDRLRERGLSAACVGLEHPHQADEALRAADIVLISASPEGLDRHADDLTEWLGRLADGHTPALAWGLPDNYRLPTGVALERLSPQVSLDEIVGRLTTMARYAPLVKRLDCELSHMQRIGQQLQRYFDEIDKEMRLAGRLQRNFLPQSLPQGARLRSACLYRPASWVSGDVYDVYEIDEQRIGVFIADAMGHGTAAALMTMFLRQVLSAQRVLGRNGHPADPSVVLEQLDACLVEQQLPDSQFVTAAYGIVDTSALELRLARGGHPFALHVAADGRIRELRHSGSLLGLSELKGEFQEARVRLQPGDKVVLYTDGVEDSFILARKPEAGAVEFTRDLHTWATLDAQTFVREVGHFLDRQEGSLHPADDVTVIVLEVTA